MHSPSAACECDQLGSSNLVCDYNTGQCPCLPFVAVADQNDTSGRLSDRHCSSCLQNYYGFHTGNGCQLCVCSVSGAASAQCDDLGVCLCKETIGGDTCDSCLDGFFSFSEAGCLSCNCSEAGSKGPYCDLVTGQCICKDNVQELKCDACADDSFNLDGENPDGCQKCFCYGHGTSCISAPGYAVHLIESESIFDCDSCMHHNWTDSHPLTDDDNLWLLPFGKTTNDVMYVQAPDLFLGNRMTSYGQVMTFDAKILGGNDLSLQGQRPIILQGNGKTIYYDAENLTLTADTQRVTVKLFEHFWRYNETTRPDYFNLYAILADLESLHVQRTFGSHVLSITNLLLVSSQPALEGEPNVTFVEQCTCAPVRNVEGQSCMTCVPGTRRETVNGSVYETCKSCDCSGRAETVPADCVPSTGECLNCRNGTTGFHCEACAANVEGQECDTCTDTYWGLGAHGCTPCGCDAIGASSNVCDKVTGQCTCKDHVVGRVCDACEDNFYNLQDTGCQECDSCYTLVFDEVQILRGMQDNLTIYVSQMKSQDNNTELGPFRDRVAETLHRMNILLTFLANADSVDAVVTPEVHRMQGLLRHLQEALDIDVTSSVFRVNTTLFHADNLIAHCQKVYDETVITVTDTHSLLSGPIADMTVEMETLLSGLQHVESSLSQVSTGAMADANRVLGLVKDIETSTADAHTMAKLALEHVQKANTIHQNSTRRVSALEQSVAAVTDLSDSVAKDADHLHGNATLVRDEVVVALLNSTAMQGPSVDGDQLQRHARQLIGEAELLQESATVAETTIETGQVAIIQDVEEATAFTSGLRVRTEALQREAEAMFGRVDVAHQMALAAMSNETQVFKDADDMLDVMQHFTNRASDVELQANTSLALVQQVKGMSEASIKAAVNFQRELEVTSRAAQASIDSANSSSRIATQQVKVYKPVYDEALKIEASAAPLLNDIQQVASRVHKASQQNIEPARITCSGLESQVAAVEERTQKGLEKADEAATQVGKARDEIAAIMKDLQNIQELDMTAVDALRRRVREARAEFDARNLTEDVRVLREAALQQRVQIEALKRRRDDAARAVRRIRDVQQQLRP